MKREPDSIQEVWQTKREMASLEKRRNSLKQVVGVGPLSFSCFVATGFWSC
jgi:hypothetical protein